MKRIALSLLLLLAAAAAHADSITLADTACSNFVCFSPAPGVDYVGTDSTYGKAIANVDGVLYTGAVTSAAPIADGVTTITADLRSADGRVVLLTATFRKWVVTVNAGRLHTRLTRVELLGGTLQ